MTQIDIKKVPVFPVKITGPANFGGLQMVDGETMEWGGISMRPYAAIKLKVPDSGIDWLDAMIVESLKNDFAAKAVSGICANELPDKLYGEIAVERAYRIADAMVAASADAAQNIK